MDKRNKRGTWISLLFHLLGLVCAINLHSVNVLVPSRSDGMEVELISPTEVVKQRVMPAKPAAVQVENTNPADVNVKQPDTTPVPTQAPVPPKLIPSPTPTPTPKPKKPVTNNQINDLLNDIAPATKPSNKGKATGGTNLGTSDTTNMQANYADLVIARVKPYIILPDGVDPNATAVVEITLLPNMQVFNEKLIKSSGNPDYDNNIQQAINRAGQFPDLPDGANFADFRKIRLTFKPQ